MRSNDPVTMSYAESLLKDRDIVCFIADQGMSVLEGSIGILPRRILVSADDLEEARRLIGNATLTSTP